MFCSVCNEEMVPLKGSICASGTNTYCAPFWACSNCDCVLYLKSEEEFDLWISEYTGENYNSLPDYIDLLNNIDEESIEFIKND